MSATAAAGFVVGLAVGLVVGFCRLPLAIPNKVRIASRDDKERSGGQSAARIEEDWQR